MPVPNEPGFEAGTVTHLRYGGDFYESIADRTNRKDPARAEIGSQKVAGGSKAYKWREVLDYAYTKGFIGFEIVGQPQFYPMGNEFICIIVQRARFADGTKTEAVGDAYPGNCKQGTAPSFVRMADTRAKARALHDALNLDANLAEEFGDDDVNTFASAPHYTPKQTQQPKFVPVSSNNAPNPKKGNRGLRIPANGPDGTYLCEDCGNEVAESASYTSEENAYYNNKKAGHIVCADCRKKYT